MRGVRICWVVIGLMLGSPALAPAVSTGPDGERRQELVRLVRQDCGACHGMTLAGGLGPPLLPAVLRERPQEALVQTILHGRPGTPMPPWRPFLSEPEAGWIVDRLLEGFPTE